MAVFRIEKTRDYTVMSNHHLRNSKLSLKAKGLLSLMLSLPEDWDYTLNGLATLNNDGIDSIRASVKELEAQGYLSRRRLRNEMGQLTETEYIIHEQPASAEPPELENPTLEKPTLDNPILEKPAQAQPTLGNPMQLNTYQQNTKISSTDKSYPSYPQIDKMEEWRAYRKIIEANIEYQELCTRLDKDRLEELVELILETVCSTRKTTRISGESISTELVRSRLLKLNQFHIEYVFQGLDSTTTKIRNIKSYLLTSLYNAPATMSNYYSAEVNHDLHNWKEEQNE